MTIATQTSKAAFSGNGVSTVFPLPFPFLRNADIKILLLRDGFETPLDEGTHYALSGAGTSAGGSLTVQTPPATGQTLVAYRAPDIVQEVDYVENSAFPAETHEAALDLLTMICQSLQEQIDRAVLYPVSTPEGDILDSRAFLNSTTQSRDAALAAEQNAAASAGQAAVAAAQASASADTVEELVATADAVVKVSGGDTAGGSLSAKLLAGNGLAESIENPGGEEALRLSVALAASSGLGFEAGLLRVQAGAGLAVSGSGLAADVGTTAGKLVQLGELGALPAVSGANLTGLSALAKLGLIANRLVYIDAAGVPQQLALGAAGTVLKSAGPSAAPTFGASGGGMWEYVSKVVLATTVQSVEFTNLDFNAYDYRIHSVDISAATGVQVGYGAVPTYVTAANSYYFNRAQPSDNTSATFGNIHSSGTSMPLWPTPLNGSFVTGAFDATLVAHTATRVGIAVDSWLMTSYSFVYQGFAQGTCSITSIATAIKVLGTNMASGTIRLYRRART